MITDEHGYPQQDYGVMRITSFGVAIVEGDSHLSKWVLEQRRLNVQEEYCRLFEKHIPVGGVVVDVGACIGDHTLSYSQMVGPTGSVYAFEPNRPAFECLRFNMRRQPGVTCLHCALGERRGRGFIQIAGEQPGNLGAAQFVSGAGDIPIEALDSFFFQRLDFMKIDAEGCELEILMGARSTLKRCRTVMLIEINRAVLAKHGVAAPDVFRFLDQMGYDYKPSEPHLSIDLPELDILALPR